MANNFSRAALALSLGIFIFTGCSKETKSTNPASSVQSNTKLDNNGNSIRLTHTESEFGILNYAYNPQGLVDRIDADYFNGYLKHEYNSDGRLIVARFYSPDDVLQIRIEFFYDHNDVVHEIWYNGYTSDKNDEVFYTYNNKGEVTRMESFFLGYYALFNYSPQGNMTTFAFYYGDILNIWAEYSYNNRLKNPTSAVPGRVYDYFSANGQFDRNKWYSTSQYFVAYDALGVGTVLSDQDAAKTVSTAGPANYVATSDFTESTGEVIHFVFSYEKTNNAGGNKVAKNKMTIAKLLDRRTITTLPEKIKQFKAQQHH